MLVYELIETLQLMSQHAEVRFLVPNAGYDECDPLNEDYYLTVDTVELDTVLADGRDKPERTVVVLS